MPLYSNADELAAKGPPGYQLVCPKCASHTFKMPVTSAGVVTINFESGKPVIVRQQLDYTWSESDTISCLECQWEGLLQEAKILEVEEILSRALVFINRCEADGEDKKFLDRLQGDITQVLENLKQSKAGEAPLTPDEG